MQTAEIVRKPTEGVVMAKRTGWVRGGGCTEVSVWLE